MENTKIMTVSGVQCYEFDGVAYLHLETVARRLGFTQEKNGVEYVKWERVDGYLRDLGVSPEVGKDGYIPENIFYRLAMKAKNETAERFQALVADEIIPAIRRTGAYSVRGAIASSADYLKAAQIVSRCPNKRLQIVLSLLEAGGIRVEVPVEAEQAVALMETAKPKKSKNPPRVPNKYSEQNTLSQEERDAMADEALEILWKCPMTVQEMARLTGIGRANLSQIRHGYRRAGPDRAKIIIDVLGPHMESVEVGV